MLSKILKHPSILHAQEITAICAPLQKLNISYFSHVKINHDKKFSAISSHPQFVEHYLKNKFYKADIHMVDEKRFGNIFIWDGIQFSGESARMCREAGEFGIHNPFTIIDRNKNEINYYHFASKTHNKQINQIYLANLDLLKLFIARFHEMINQSKSLAKAYDLTFDTIATPKTSFEDNSISYDRSGFIQCLTADKNAPRLQIEDVLLSKRQSEILRLVLCGKTMKEISRILNLSERTIGHYFETVKLKLNVSSRSELFSKTMKNGIMSSLFNFL